MSIMALTPDQRDALQEITNIGMGRAGASLAGVLDTFVQLSIPRVNIVEVLEISDAIAGMVGKTAIITAIRQSFRGTLQGEGIVIYGQRGCNDLADLMGYGEVMDRTAEQGLLLDVSNMIVGACLSGVADQIDAELSFSAPSIMAEQIPVEILLRPADLAWSHALLLEVSFRIQNREFMCHLIVLMLETSTDKLRGNLDKLIASF